MEETIVIRLDSNTKHKLQEAAKANKLPLSAYAREILIRFSELMPCKKLNPFR